MLPSSLITVFLMVCGASYALGVDIVLLPDLIDDAREVDAVASKASVNAFRARLQKFQKTLSSKNQAEIERLFGKPLKMLPEAYVLPVAQARAIFLSGFINVPNKRHEEFYRINDTASLWVWYGDDGESPITVMVSLKVDKNFPKLTATNLEQRLAWDQARFEKLVKFVKRREKEAKREKKK